LWLRSAFIFWRLFYIGAFEWLLEAVKEGKIPTLQTAPLGNAQEIIKIFNKATEIPVITSPSISRINEVYRNYGFKLE